MIEKCLVLEKYNNYFDLITLVDTFKHFETPNESHSNIKKKREFPL